MILTCNFNAGIRTLLLLLFYFKKKVEEINWIISGFSFLLMDDENNDVLCLYTKIEAIALTGTKQDTSIEPKMTS